MKKILVACNQQQFDVALYKSLAHLKKSCHVEIVFDGYSAFDKISDKSFDLVIIDFQLPGVDSLELVESIQYIDPGVPVILMLAAEHKAILDEAPFRKAQAIVRPFQPLIFLRLIDKLLYKQLNRHRQLVTVLQKALATLCLQTDAISALLVENSGQILASSSETNDTSLTLLGNLAIEPTLSDEVVKTLLAQDKMLRHYHQKQEAYGLHLTPVIENLHLGILSPLISDPQQAKIFWERVETTILDMIVAIHKYDQGTTKGEFNNNGRERYKCRIISRERLYIPFKLDNEEMRGGPARSNTDQNDALADWRIILLDGSMVGIPNFEFERDEIEINWDFMSNASLLN